MLPVVRLIFSASILFFVLGCGLLQSNDNSAIQKKEIDKKLSRKKVFPYPYEAVWRAAQISLKYPISVNNMDIGLLETEWIRGVDGFTPPVLLKETSSGIRYKIIVNIVKGKVSGQNSVRVSVFKKIERQRDFFSDEESLESDGLEEKVLLYRMEREIIIDEAIKKAAALNK